MPIIRNIIECGSNFIPPSIKVRFPSNDVFIDLRGLSVYSVKDERSVLE